MFLIVFEIRWTPPPVLFSLSCYVSGLAFRPRQHTFFLENPKVLLAGAMAAYRPAESEKPCQYLYFPGKQNHSNWQYILELHHQELLQNVLHNFILCLKNNIQSFQLLE